MRVYRGADVGSDHQLLVAKVKLKLKRIQKPTSVKPIAVEKLKKQNIKGDFQLALQNRFDSLKAGDDIEEPVGYV